ncbi:T6SS phospholipase effector Tle1-like catalytic domain-containing protein [Paraherbaspirillum soli]|uniref:T6SS phospholipase effector Tle1-like catalytic domain-containing protein n=1 Tax=Paraherbaspirillum soli TaxID=631222 RepID=A0ABW0MDP7_9BURK
MNVPIQSAPLIVRGRAEDVMALNFAETCALDGMNGESFRTAHLLCQCFVKIGLFFDGTNNNRIRDEPLKCHTNIVKLFNAHKAVDGIGDYLQQPHHYRIYIPGLGTRFPENREWRESQEGKAFGKGGQARILYALLEVYNAVYQSINDGVKMFEDHEITAKLQQYAQDVDTGDPLRDAHDPRPDRRSWFGDLSKELDKRLRKVRAERPLPRIPNISLNVFGFSRGAVQARAFCYWFNDLLQKDGTFASMPAEIKFLGLFDSVASIGPANSVAESTPIFWADGHFVWAKEILQPLPDCVKHSVHYIAAHEQRRNFPVTRVKQGAGGKVLEYLYPGVHSDVGGGYAPGEQGKSRSMDLLLSQIPLLHMHHAATVAGVPLAACCICTMRPPSLACHWPRIA